MNDQLTSYLPLQLHMGPCIVGASFYRCWQTAPIDKLHANPALSAPIVMSPIGWHVIKYKFEVLYATLQPLFHYILEENMVLFTALYLSDSFSVFFPHIFLSSENHAPPNWVILNDEVFLSPASEENKHFKVIITKQRAVLLSSCNFLEMWFSQESHTTNIWWFLWTLLIMGFTLVT